MRFELEPDNYGQTDELLLADIRRVADMLRPGAITKDLYNKHGRWCAATMQKRFGNWNLALLKAGIEPKKLVNIARDELLQDLKAVAAALGASTLTRDQYVVHGRFSEGPMYRAFGNWSKALRAAGLVPSFEPLKVTDAICFEAIEAVWQRQGRQPRQAELRIPDVKVRGRTIAMRFGSWRKALEAFVAYVNAVDDDASPLDSAQETTQGQPDAPPCNPKSNETESTPRNVGWRLRFLVMRRDGFRCTNCGRSPATQIGVSLVIDHHIPWSQGGPTTFENLRTLCEECNGGRGTLSYDAPGDHMQ